MCLMLVNTLAEAPKAPTKAVRVMAAPTPAEVALVLVRAARCMLRRTTPEMKMLHRRPTLEFSGARSASAGMSS
jgi:hypothetical protein